MSIQNKQRIRQFSKMELLARQVVEGFITGLHKSPFHGFSVEFAEHKQYNKGESTRHIDWKLYAKTDKLFTKRYEEETNLRCQLVIDTSSSMAYPEKGENKLNFAIHAAAALTHLLKSQRDAIGLSCFSDSVGTHLPAQLNEQHIQRIYHELTELEGWDEKNRPTSAARSLHEIAERIRKRSLVIIFSDLLDNSSDDAEVFEALQHLKYNKHEVVLFHVLDRKTELDFEFDNRPYTFIDSETGEQVKMNPTEIKQAYQQEAAKAFKALDIKCGQMGIDFVPVDVQEPFDKVLLKYLAKRARMK